MNIFKGNTRLIGENFVGCPALSKQVDNKLDSKASAFDNGFADKYIRVNPDIRLPVRRVTLSALFLVCDRFYPINQRLL
ncbi:hypothetical protein [Calothrix sp. NIES-2100]|uniref:hypothetical protein n=1 Tax=Calothrix sp. NIES-2100 TaxID=1954172 RepID=UPI00403F2553